MRATDLGLRLPRARARASAGFTLAEVAIVILIVGITLVGLLQGLSKARLTMAHTKNLKIATQLALLTMGQIESGEYIEDDMDGLSGSYAEEGYGEWFFEVLVGEETFSEQATNSADRGFFDSISFREERRLENEEEEDDREDEDLPFEKVRVRVQFPGFLELKDSIVIERWIPWEQVYGPSEEDEAADPLNPQ